MTDSKPQLQRRPFHGARRKCAASTPSTIGSSDHDDYLVTGLHQRTQRRYRRLGGAEKGEAHLFAKEAMETVGFIGGGLETLFTQQNLRLTTLIGVETLDQEHTVEVVQFVLKYSTLILVSLDVEFVALEVKAHQVYGVRTGYVPTESRHRETAPFKGPLAVGFDPASGASYMVSIIDSARAAMRPSIFSISVVTSFNTGSP